jgi:hypothetical protein
MNKIFFLVLINLFVLKSFSQNNTNLQKINDIFKKEYTTSNVSFNKYAKVIVIDADDEEFQFDIREIVLKYSEKLYEGDSHRGGYAVVKCLSVPNKLSNCIRVTKSGKEIDLYTQVVFKLRNKLDYNLMSKYISELKFK